MFKRLLCCLLICTLLAAAVPSGAFAGESESALKRLMEMSYLDQLCAVNSNAPGWHEGMSLTHANSLQMETALRSLLENDILPTLEYLEETATAQVATGKTGALSDDLRKERNDCRALRDTVQAALDIIEYERRSVPESAQYVFDGTYLTENQAEAAARRVLLGVDRLEKTMNAVGSTYPEWEDEVARLRELLCPDDTPVPAEVSPKTPLQSHIVGVRADYMNLLLNETKRIAAEEQSFSGGTYNREDEVEIYAVPRDKILFDVRDANNKPISDARVVAWNVKTKKQFVGTYDADAEGYLFTTKSLGLEADGYLEIGYEIKRNGYENHFANDHLCQGGDIFHTVLKSTDGNAYISGTSFNGEDMQWSQTNVYITEANDADQTISVYLDQASGTPSGTVYMFYNDINGNPQKRSASASRASDGRIRADFTQKWCQILDVGDKVRFSLNEDGSDAIDALLMANAPACSEVGLKEPRFETNNQSLMARFLPSGDFFKIVIPEQTPIFGGTTISVNFPGELLPVTIYEGLDGTFLVLLTKGEEFKDFLKDDIEGDAWKKQSQAQTDREVSKAAEKAEDLIKNQKSNPEMGENAKKKPFLGQYTAWWSVFFCAQGRVEIDRSVGERTVSGQLSTGFTVGLKAEFPRQVCVTPPIKFNVGVSFGVGAMLNGLYKGHFTDYKVFDFKKLDISFGALSILIPTSVYISLGIGVEFLEGGVKGSVSLRFALPIISTDYKKNVGVFIDMRITIYGQLLLLHVEWLIARVSWAFENGESGEVNGYVIVLGHLPKNNGMGSGFGMPKDVSNDGDLLSGRTPVLGEQGVENNDIDVDTSVIWNYEPSSVDGSKAMRVSSTLPKNFELYNGDTVDMAVWTEDNRILISANGLDKAQELVIPEDPEGPNTALSLAKAGIESGAYKIIDVNANCGDCHYDYVGSFRMPVQVAVVSVTYAKSFKTVEQTIGEKTVEATAPNETETLAMAIVLTMNSTTPLLLDTDLGTPAVYVFLNTTNAIKEVYPYPCQIHLKESPSVSGRPCIDTEKSFGVTAGAFFEDGTFTSAFYYYGGERIYEEDSDSTFRLIATGTTGDIPVYIGVDNDGTIVSGILPNVHHEEYAEFAEGKDIDDFVLYDLADSEGEVVAFYLEKTAQEGMDALKAVPMKLRGVEQTPRYGVFEWESSEQWDFETDIPAVELNIDKIINYHSLNATLYWFDTGLKKIGGSEEKQEIARVRGVYFDWFHRKASKPFTIATLYGNDGETGELIPNLAPLASFACGDRFFFARALEKDNKEGENDSANWQQGAYMIYDAPISNIIKMRVIGAAAEYHAMSAGRSGNFTFTLLNDGNMPISSATMRVSRILKNPDGSETKETVAEYSLNPLDESSNTAKFWSVDSASPDVRRGIVAVRQIDTIFDAVEGDPVGDVSNAVADSPRILQCFLPESVFAYDSSIAIPEDWDGLQLLRAEIVRAYGPIQLAGSNGETRYAMYDMVSGGVYAVDESGKASNEPLLTANGLPLRVQKSEPLDLVVDSAEIALSCKMHEKDGERYIASAISQTGNTAMNVSSGNIILRAYVDDETDYPTFVHTFKNHTTGDRVLNLDAPISTLTGGRAAEKLTIVVSDAAEGNLDLSQLNNYQTFYLNDELKWRVQPTDQTVKTGGTAVFTAEAMDGTKPYSYKWFRIDGTDSYEVGQGPTLVLKGCTDDMNGQVYCCVVTDASGRTLISTRANLWVKKVVPPPTGDDSRLPIWFAMLAASMMIVIAYVRKRRRSR